MTTSPIYRSAAGEQAVRDWYETILARWPVAHARLTLPTRHGDTFAVVSGDPAAPALVLLHGAGSNSATWAGDVAAYSRGFRVAAVDLIGEAGFSAPTRPAYDGPAYAEWLSDVLDGLGVEAACLVGMSLGGWVALRFGTTIPGRVRALALIVPSGLVPVRASFTLRLVALSLLGEWGQARLVRLMFGPQPVDPAVISALRLMSSHFKSRVEAPPIMPDEALRRLALEAVPMLAILGARDGFCDAEQSAARLRALVPHAQAVIIPGAGHVLLGTAPRVLAFLGSPAPVYN